MRLGSYYIGSTDLQTSVANEEIIPNPPENWTMKYNFYEFSFINDQACRVKINDSNPIYLRAGQGFEMDSDDSPIRSFIIVESGITFNWIAAY